MDKHIFGIIGGSGLYEMEALQNVHRKSIETPFGLPSDELICGTLHGVECVFLPRHGCAHHLTPSEVNYRANIWALKSLGVKSILSVSAVGSLRERIEPGHLVCPTQFIDRTRSRPSTFFSDGIVAHVQFGQPIELELQRVVLEAAQASGAVVHDGGCYVCIEGPSFSTLAESQLFRSWGADIIGMTNLPEARLAREAEIAYATLALSTDYDCWREGHDEVSVESVVQLIKKNVSFAQKVIQLTAESLGKLGVYEWPAHSALAGGAAIMTKRAYLSEEVKTRLAPIIGRYIGD